MRQIEAVIQVVRTSQVHHGMIVWERRREVALLDGGRPLTPPLSPMRWGCLSCLTPTQDGQYYPFPGYRHLAPVGGCPMEGAFIFTTPSAKIPSSTSTMTRLLWATELANRAACCTS